MTGSGGIATTIGNYLFNPITDQTDALAPYFHLGVL